MDSARDWCGSGSACRSSSCSPRWLCWQRRGLGQFLIQPFFVVVGLSTPLAGVFSEGLWILVYAAIVVGTHAVVVLALARCRVPMAEMLVASQAAIGGPSTALALATSLERDDLAVPGVALGLLGYAIGTYLGVVMAAPGWF